MCTGECIEAADAGFMLQTVDSITTVYYHSQGSEISTKCNIVQLEQTGA